MPACPACGKSNEEQSQRCVYCGASLKVPPFATATPATRRMGHTMLGVAPLASQSQAPEDAENPKPSPEDFQPFAPVPATLAGLATNEPADAPHAAQSTTPDKAPQPRSETLKGFAAVTRSEFSPPAQQGMSNPQEPATRPQEATAKHATLMGVSPIAPPDPFIAPKNSNPSPPPDGRVGLTSAPAGTAPGHATLLGVSPLAREQKPLGVATSAAKSGSVGGATLMMGAISPLYRAEQAPGGIGAPEAKAPQANATMPGVLPLGDDGSRQSASAVVAAGASAPAGNATAPAGALNATVRISEASAQQLLHGSVPHKTVLGVAPEAHHLLGAGVPQLVDSPADVEAQEPRAVHKGTLLGVAMPGIAPLQPGQAKPSPLPPEPPWAQPPLPPNAPPVPLEARPGTDRSLIAWMLAALALILVLVVTVGLYLWWTAVHLTVQVSSTEAGAEQLVLSCSNCPDGTTVNLESKTAHFQGNRAAVELAKRLVVGTNKLTLRVNRPNRARSEIVNVTVPIEFRVTSSIAELAGDPPSISVQLEAPPGTRFTIQSRTHSVGSSGKLTLPIDVSGSLVGPAPMVVPFEQRLGYEVVRDGTTTKGTLVVRTGITPLEVATPGAAHITQNPTFTLSGRTSAQARLTANGHPIAVGPDGAFRQEMALSAPGSTKLVIRAQEVNHAPRIIEVSLERVTNLKQRAEEIARSLPADFDAVSSISSEKPDTLVSLRGEVVAIEAANASTRIAATATNCKHAPCLFSVHYGGPLSLRAGSRFLSIGKARLVPRSANANERDLTLDASLVVEDPAR